MGSTDLQLKQAYELNSMSPVQIAEDMGFDIVAVKAKLMQISAKYRKDCGYEEEGGDALNFSDDDLCKVNQVILETALCAETSDGSVDYKTRLTAAMYIRDDKKGRKDIRQAIQNTSFNIFDINASLQQMREGAQRVKAAINGNSNQKVIEA